MSSEHPKKWIVKIEDGRLKGPYSTQKILQKISQGIFTGDELISRYPGSDWYPITKDPVFYDYLLSVLSGENGEIPDEDSPAPERSQASKAVKTKPPEDLDLDETESLEEVELEKTKIIRTPLAQEPDKILELKNVKREVGELARKKLLKFGAIATVVLLLIFLIIPDGKNSSGRIHLQRPNFSISESLSKSKIDEKTKKAVEAYLKDTFVGYRMAESILVELVERDQKNFNLYGLLCLTQLELWPFSFQDSKDLSTLDKVSMKVGALNPTHLYSETCRVVSLIVKGKLQDAKAITDRILGNYSGEGSAPIPFYYFKSKLLETSGEYITAQGYANSAQKLWASWLMVYVLEAEILMKQQKNSEAHTILSKIYKKNKSHAKTKVLLGILEFIQFRNFEKSKIFLQSGLEHSEKVESPLASRGFLTLSQIAIEEGDQADALEYAKKAYVLQPSNSTAKSLVVELGGRKQLEKTEVKAHQLILEGDQFVRQGDCQSAQAHYKSAYQIDGKLAIAAYKAGECLWKLSFSLEAIDWLQKAIKADGKLMQAYLLLADFYSQRFDFTAAARTLSAAQVANPKSHEVFRGYALIELRRKNPASAVGYAKQALLIYSTDIHSLVLLATAQLQVGKEIQEAYSNAKKAIEIDPSHRKAQIIFAKAVGAIQGVNYGVQYLRDLINTFPLAYEYRIALGRLLLEDEQFLEAEKVFSNLIEIQEKPKEALIGYGRALEAQNYTEKALDSFFRAAVYDPSDARPFFLAGEVLLGVNKALSAKKQFERVLSINKSYPLVRYNIGRAELLLKNPKEALKMAKNEKKVNPNLSAAYILAAEAHTDMKQFDLCATEYQRAIKLRPQSSRIYVKVASCYRKGGNFDSASSMLNIASKIESGNPSIYKEQGALFESRGDLAKAIQAYQQYFVLNPNAPDRRLIENRIQNLKK